MVKGVHNVSHSRLPYKIEADRLSRTTLAPCRPKYLTIPLPSTPQAPVITTTLPLRSNKFSIDVPSGRNVLEFELFLYIKDPIEMSSVGYLAQEFKPHQSHLEFLIVASELFHGFGYRVRLGIFHEISVYVGDYIVVYVLLYIIIEVEFRT